MADLTRFKSNTKIKICGLTRPEEAWFLNESDVDFGGFVFYDKSKRNITLNKAKDISANLAASIRRVAVMVSPNARDIGRIQDAGIIDMIQIHGALKTEAVREVALPVWYAVNLKDDLTDAEDEQGIINRIYGDLYALPDHLKERITGILADAPQYGSGQTFNWRKSKRLLKAGAQSPPDGVRRDLILAGGLNESNVAEGISLFEPDVVDVSSGVERADGAGKDKDKITAFVRAVRGERA